MEEYSSTATIMMRTHLFSVRTNTKKNGKEIMTAEYYFKPNKILHPILRDQPEVEWGSEFKGATMTLL